MTADTEDKNRKPAFDVFISHASEDKEDVARPLATLLIQSGLRVWLDEFQMVLGDSLRRKIDAGLANSRFGVVVLSKPFFGKEWPQKELDALVAREDGSTSVILPVWHNMSRLDVSAYSPILADRLSVSTDAGLASVAAAIYKAVNVSGRAANEDVQDSRSAKTVQERSVAGPKRINDLVIEFIDRVQQNAETQVEVTGMRTGFYDLDRLMGGLQPGELYVVAARPSVGCTTFALNIAEHVAAADGLPVLYFSPRAKSQEIVNRLIASTGRIDRWRLAASRLNSEEWTRLVDAVEHVHQMPLYVDDSTPMSIHKIADGVRVKREELGSLGVVVIDSLDALTISNAPEAEDDVIRQLWALARDSNCAVIVTISLPRSVDTRRDKRPLMADVCEGRAVEQSAAAVLLLYRDDYYNRDSIEPGVMEVILAKHRGGVTGTIKLLFMRAIAKLENLSNDPKAEAPRTVPNDA